MNGKLKLRILQFRRFSPRSLNELFTPSNLGALRLQPLVIIMKIASFFSGAGGLDLGFHQAGYDVIWANEYDKSIWETFRINHPNTELDTRSITEIEADDLPKVDIDGIIGGPPCQSWSEAGALRGIEDHRGQLFFDFIRILKERQPKFFLAENVAGMLQPRHRSALDNIKAMFESCGYTLSVELLNASDYEVPQDRLRLIFVGIRKDLKVKFTFPSGTTIFDKFTLEQAIGDLKDSAVPSGERNTSSAITTNPKNHEYMTGGFSTIYMSRNRVRSWEEVSYTIQAGGRHAPIHPQAPKMQAIGPDKKIFVPGFEHLYRRLTVRECARIQTFPDDFEFIYSRVADGYKMVGNAVPVNLAFALATKIATDLEVKLKSRRRNAVRQPSFS